jgi:hypothetical protein
VHVNEYKAFSNDHRLRRSTSHGREFGNPAAG